ncbi:MAG: nicotinate-nucleotide adenylyltransferase [Marinobacter sp.]|nr:nicotinate-nucleotide adenylyltransferase [Marinobacter sp.]
MTCAEGLHLVFGGTFDPVHHGHLRMAVELKERLGVSSVHLMPSKAPPHRPQPGASAEERLALLALAVNGEPGLQVDDRELRRDSLSWTADSLQQLRDELGPACPLAMVVGTDAFAGFDSWRDWQRIPELAHIVVIRRLGAELAAGSAPSQLQQARAADSVEALHRQPAGLVLSLALPVLDISATMVRQRLASGRSARYLVPDRVLQEIQARGLYGSRSSSGGNLRQ